MYITLRISVQIDHNCICMFPCNVKPCFEASHTVPLCSATIVTSVLLSNQIVLALQHCSTNGKLHIKAHIKAQPSTPSIWPLSPTRLGIWPQDLGLPNEYRIAGYFGGPKMLLANFNLANTCAPQATALRTIMRAITRVALA